GQAGAGHLDGVTDAVAGLGRPHGHAGALTDHLELGDGVGTLEVGGDEEGGLALVLEPLRELAGEGGLTGALEAGEHDDRGRALGEAQVPRLAAEDLDELGVDDLDDLLARVEGAGDLGPERPLAHGGGELTHHRQGDVRLEEGAPDLGDGGGDVLLGQPALAAEVAEGGCQAVGEAGEQGRSSCSLGPVRAPGYLAAPTARAAAAPGHGRGARPRAVRATASTRPDPPRS